MKNALPSVRATISATKVGGGREPVISPRRIGDVGCGEGGEFHPIHVGVAMEFSEQQPERMLAVQIVCAVARDRSRSRCARRL